MAMSVSRQEQPSAPATLPVLVFGPSGNGYGLLGKKDHVPPQAVDAFMRFVKAISWRPAKLEAPNLKGLALLPCQDGIFVCRISETLPDSFGRRPTMLVEGIYCPDVRSIWLTWLDWDNWPQEALTSSSIAAPVAQTSSSSPPSATYLPRNWTPATAVPVVFLSEQLLSMPKGWSAPGLQAPAKGEPAPNRQENRHISRPSASRPQGDSRPMPDHHAKTAAPRWSSLGLGLGLGLGMVLGLLLGLALGYGVMTKPVRAEKEDAVAVSRQWREAAMRHVSASTPDALDQALVLLLTEKRDQEQALRAWQDAARESLGIVEPEELAPRLRQERSARQTLTTLLP
jgi:hypothetical protein